MELLIVAVLGLLGIAAAAVFGPRLGVAAPLLLVIVGLFASLLPFVPDVEIDPEWILAGVLPPLLYSASVSMPAMEFRREFSAIGGLSVGLVVVSSVLLGLLFVWLIPGIGLAAGIALGAIVSPTDAVATSIVKRIGVSPRIVTVLEGESLLNDATALVLLRSAIVAAGASVTFWDVLGDFVFAVVVALAIGYVVGKANLWVRERVVDPTANTVISFTVPFLAAVPSEALGASGLVAAVVAGLVTGRGALTRLSPQHRASDTQAWRTVELILEGAVFLVMGLEMSAIVADVQGGRSGIASGLLIAGFALLAVIAVRALYVLSTLSLQRSRARRGAEVRARLSAMQHRLDGVGRRQPPGSESGGIPQPASSPGVQGAGTRGVGRSTDRLAMFRTRIRRKVADIDYFTAEPLGWREGSVIVWAGMRGAVTLAAAQTLPSATPERSLLVFVAFVVAAASLIVQGSTLPMLVRWVKPALFDRAAADADREEIDDLLRDIARRVAAETAAQEAAGRASDATAEATAEEALAPAGTTPAEASVAVDDAGADRAEDARARTARGLRLRSRLRAIDEQRAELSRQRDEGRFSSTALTEALQTLDAVQISLELRLPSGDVSKT
ncbi:monovalent cation:H+ antiporter, CPA1 family [Agromyces sp. CF514]|uniref:cation:proton antiporter n=1 Tax=Agromyces sp. CF514 TaxID=1881031 RepID=UPI0008ED697E|nr:sodium:proton antiporter [Agromyces sp. CF514]SFR79323.1 monovalent cation:H+ antiporter, CPA1 family [Agromyces sp. CF514]